MSQSESIEEMFPTMDFIPPPPNLTWVYFNNSRSFHTQLMSKPWLIVSRFGKNILCEASHRKIMAMMIKNGLGTFVDGTITS